MIVIGHRGAAGRYPENTLLAIRHALDVGADAVEIDVRLVGRDLVVIHDEFLDRTTNGSGSLYDRTVGELRTLDAGKGEKIPLLSEVLDLVNARACLNIELKDTQSAAAVIDAAGEAISSNPDWRERLMLSTFEASIHGMLVTEMPDGCRFGALVKNIPGDLADYARSLGAFSLNLSRAQLTSDRVASAHDMGLQVYVYTVNETADLQRCLDLAVDGVFSDRPAHALRFLGREIAKDD